MTLIGVPLISPLPAAARPVTLTVLSLVHAYVVPVMLLLVLSTIVVIAASEQTVCVDGSATPTGKGFTVHDARVTHAVPKHPAPAVHPDLCPCISTKL